MPPAQAAHVPVVMPTELLRASEAARRLDMPTKELLRLVHRRKIRSVLVEGIAHIPVDAVGEYQLQASLTRSGSPGEMCRGFQSEGADRQLTG